MSIQKIFDFDTIAIVGISDNPERPSYFVAKFLEERGYNIIPVNPNLTEWEGKQCYPDLLSIRVKVDVVDIFRRTEAIPPIVDEAIAIKAKVVWMQEGIVNEEAAAKARDTGIEVVMDRCMKIEYLRFHNLNWRNNMKYDVLASEKSIKKTTEALKARNVNVEHVNTKEEALKRLNELIPPGKEVMTGGSTTIDQIGLTDQLKSGKHTWKNLKDAILAEKDKAKQTELRKKSLTSEYFLGSVHAVTETGQIIIVNASGSAIPSNSFSSDNVIWVVGTQKIVPTLEEGFKRVHEYCVPLEDKRMKSLGYPGTTIGKILIFEREINENRKITLIFVNEKLGF
jgi:predicted CoA-binding protein